MNDVDIMTYSGKLGNDDSTSLDEPAFSANGAIFEALAQANPSFNTQSTTKITKVNNLSKPNKLNSLI